MVIASFTCDEAAVGAICCVPAASSAALTARRSQYLPSHSHCLNRGAGCGSSARPDLREPQSSNPLGPPCRRRCSATLGADFNAAHLSNPHLSDRHATSSRRSSVKLSSSSLSLERLDEARDALNKIKDIVPTFTISLYEKGMRLNWHNKDEIVEPQVAGLRKLEDE